MVGKTLKMLEENGLGYEEIVIGYPCITAIATYRIAHVLFSKGVPLIPRIMTEWAAQVDPARPLPVELVTWGQIKATYSGSEGVSSR